MILGKSNAHILRALEREDWPSNRLAVVGAAQSGKSLIAKQLIAQTVRPLQDVAAINAYLSAPERAPLLIDDFDQFIEQEGAEDLVFHLLNSAQNAGARLVIFTKTAPNILNIELADLRSRVGTFEVMEIYSPDDDLVLQLLAQGFAQRGVFVKADVLAYLAARLDREYADISRAISALDHMARRDKSKISKALVRVFLESNVEPHGAFDQ